MKHISVIICSCLLVSSVCLAQQNNATIAKGNELYRQGSFDKAIQQYQKALGENPSSLVASYNLANAMHKKGSYPDAEKMYDAMIDNAATRDKMLQQVMFNNGVNYTRQKMLAESIDAYKKALLLNPADEDVRFNLQKALEEQRKQEQPKEQQKQQQQKEKPKQQQSKLNKKQIEQYLKSLRQKEQEVQQKMQQKSRSVTQPEKDW